MDLLKLKAAPNTITRDLSQVYGPTGNIYESIAILSKRANQISVELKHEFQNESQDLRMRNEAKDSLEERNEDPELIEISKRYERLPKPVSMAMQEFLSGQVYFRQSKK